MPAPRVINLRDTTPPAPLGRQNVRWQADDQTPRNVSASIPLHPLLVTWGVGIGQPVVTGTDVAPIYILAETGTLLSVVIAAKTAPAGADLVIDLLADGTSIMGATKLHLTDGQKLATRSSFSTQTLNAGSLLSLDVLQVGATTAGRDITVQLRLSV